MSNLDDLKLAFTWHAAMDLIGVDGDIDPEEIAWITRRFTDRGRTAGFVDADGQYLPAYHAALAEARSVLPSRPRAEKVALLDDLVAAVLADGVLDHAEGKHLAEILAMLGLGGDDLDAILGKRADVGDVDVGEPE